MAPTCGRGHSKGPGEVGMCNHHGVVDAPVGVSRPGVHNKQLSPQVVPVPMPAEAGVQPACRTCSIPLFTICLRISSHLACTLVSAAVDWREDAACRQIQANRSCGRFNLLCRQVPESSNSASSCRGPAGRQHAHPSRHVICAHLVVSTAPRLRQGPAYRQSALYRQVSVLVAASRALRNAGCTRTPCYMT